MILAKLGLPLAFCGALGTAFVFSPAGCGGSARTTKDAGTGLSAELSPSTVTRTGAASFLPHPAFAYADNAGPGAASIADIAERAMPSVVNISSTKIRRPDAQSSPFLNDPLFKHFFGPGGEAPRERREQGLGSGVIVSADGVVLTNNHVVEQADEIKVVASDRREWDAKVIGTDPKSDLAVIKLQGDVKGLKPAVIGDSSRMRLGDVVLAIGNPFALGQTVTMGIVSAKGRANVGIVDYEDFIQTDAAINPGNSGGALVNMEGQLVGINTAILSRSGGYMGIGFAIPTNMAKPIMDSLQKHGKVVRGWLGVSIQDLDQELMRALKLPANTSGVLVSDVTPAGPAARAGLQRGDVIQKVNGVPVNSTGELRNAIASAGTGVEAKLDVLREGKSRVISAKLGEMPVEAGKAQDKPGGSRAQPGSLDGLTLESLSPELRRKLRVAPDVNQGAVVTDVQPGSPAAAAGLRPGDIVLEVNRQKVDSAERFKQLYSSAKGNVLLLVHRGGSSIYVVARR
jgi:serine protease Do